MSKRRDHELDDEDDELDDDELDDGDGEEDIEKIVKGMPRPTPEQQREIELLFGKPLPTQAEYAEIIRREKELLAAARKTIKAAPAPGVQNPPACRKPETSAAAPLAPSEPQPVYPEIMTIEQVAEYLQLHPQVVYRHVRAGTLPASRIGRTIRFKKSVLDAFLEKDGWSAAGKYLAFAEEQKMLHRQGGGRKPDSVEPSDRIPATQSPEPRRDVLDEDRPRRAPRFSADVD